MYTCPFDIHPMHVDEHCTCSILLTDGRVLFSFERSGAKYNIHCWSSYCTSITIQPPSTRSEPLNISVWLRRNCIFMPGQHTHTHTEVHHVMYSIHECEAFVSLAATWITTREHALNASTQARKYVNFGLSPNGRVTGAETAAPMWRERLGEGFYHQAPILYCKPSTQNTSSTNARTYKCVSQTYAQMLRITATYIYFLQSQCWCKDSDMAAPRDTCCWYWRRFFFFDIFRIALHFTHWRTIYVRSMLARMMKRK